MQQSSHVPVRQEHNLLRDQEVERGRRDLTKDRTGSVHRAHSGMHIIVITNTQDNYILKDIRRPTPFIGKGVLFQPGSSTLKVLLSHHNMQYY